jgi:hypothetical protein
MDNYHSSLYHSLFVLFGRGRNLSHLDLGEGVIGVYSGNDKISLHPGSLLALQEHSQGKYPGMKICFASSADTPFAEKVGRATLKLLELVPDVTVWDLVMRDWDNKDVNQIGRQPPLSRYVRGDWSLRYAITKSWIMLI